MFPFFCSKLHGNRVHLNLLVASNRNQLELAKALKKKKRERERLKKDTGCFSEVVDKDAAKLQEEAEKQPGNKTSLFSHLC